MESTKKQTSVLIAGAGITGLVLALSLVRNGISVRIVDKEERGFIGRRGLGLHGRSLELYKVLGVLPQILARAGPVPQPKVYSPDDAYHSGKTVPFFPSYENTPSKLHIDTVFLSQDVHESIVRDILASIGCTVEMNTELVGFEQYKDDGYVISRLKGPDGKIEEVKSSWLVGADGAHSIVRKQSGLSFLGEHAPSDLMVIADVTVKCDLDRDTTHIWGEPAKKAFMMLPHEDKSLPVWTVTAMGPQLDLPDIASGLEVLQREFWALTGRKDVKFESTSWLIRYRPHMRMVDKFRAGRVLVAGDAAHVHSATGGQGLNTGIQDAVNLGWKLALVEKKLAGDALLDSFSEERLPVVAMMLQLTSALYDKTLKAQVGDFGGLTREFALRQFGVNYRKSGIIVDETAPKDGSETYDPYRSGHDEEASAGDRAPDADGLVGGGREGIVQAYDLFGSTHHTVLVFAPSLAYADPVLKFVESMKDGLFKAVVLLPQSVELSESGGAGVLKDGTGWAYKNYRVREGDTAVVVIRPDSFIGARVGGVDGLKEYSKATSIFTS